MGGLCEFRREAELARVGYKSAPKLAKDLRISDQTLREWIKQADVDAGRAEDLSTDERAELRKTDPHPGDGEEMLKGCGLLRPEARGGDRDILVSSLRRRPTTHSR